MDMDVYRKVEKRVKQAAVPAGKKSRAGQAGAAHDGRKMKAGCPIQT